MCTLWSDWTWLAGKWTNCKEGFRRNEKSYVLVLTSVSNYDMKWNEVWQPAPTPPLNKRAGYRPRGRWREDTNAKVTWHHNTFHVRHPYIYPIWEVWEAFRSLINFCKFSPINLSFKPLPRSCTLCLLSTVKSIFNQY